MQGKKRGSNKSDKVLVPKTYEGLSKLNSEKKITTQLEHGHKTEQTFHQRGHTDGK